MKSLVALVLGCLLLLVLCVGCDFALSPVENLMKPPQLTEQQNLIYTALKESTKESITLLYPASEQNGASFLIRNIDDEPSDEAIVFLKEDNGSQAVRIYILDQVDGQWQVVWDGATLQQVTDITRVNFISTPDGATNIVVGFQLEGVAQMLLSVYVYEHNSLQSIFETVCLSYMVCDLSGSGEQELVTLKKKNIGSTIEESIQVLSEEESIQVLSEEESIQILSDDLAGTYMNRGIGMSEGVEAVLYGFRTEQWTEVSKTDMHDAALSYASVEMGVLTDGTPALYLDAMIPGEQCVTEVLIAPQQHIQNLVQGALLEETRRPAQFPIRNLAGDGVYCIPYQMMFPEYSQKESQLYLLEWYHFSFPENIFVRQAVTYSNYSLGYEFYLPDRWVGTVTARLDPSKNETSFLVARAYEWQDEPQLLLKLQVIQKTKQSLDELLPPAYRLLAQRGNLYYVGQLKRTGTEFDLTQQELEQMFRLIS